MLNPTKYLYKLTFIKCSYERHCRQSLLAARDSTEKDMTQTQNITIYLKK